MGRSQSHDAEATAEKDSVFAQRLVLAQFSWLHDLPGHRHCTEYYTYISTPSATLLHVAPSRVQGLQAPRHGYCTEGLRLYNTYTSNLPGCLLRSRYSLPHDGGQQVAALRSVLKYSTLTWAWALNLTGMTFPGGNEVSTTFSPVIKVESPLTL